MLTAQSTQCWERWFQNLTASKVTLSITLLSASKVDGGFSDFNYRKLSVDVMLLFKNDKSCPLIKTMNKKRGKRVQLFNLFTNHQR